MMLPRLLLLLFAAALSRVAYAADDGMDLYVRERFHDVNGEPCGSCLEGDGCYLRSRSFFLRNACVNRDDAKASFFEELEEGLVCRQDAPASCEDEAAPAFDAVAVDDCKQTWTVDACADSQHMRKLSGWCTASDAAVGEYTVPLLNFLEFDDVAACGSADYNQVLLPDEGGACIAMSYISNDGTHVDGSRQGACNGRVFNAVRYATPDCTGEPQRTLLDGSSDVCPADAPGPFMYTEDCGAPKLHCKSSPLLGDAATTQAAKTAVADEAADAAAAGDAEGGGSNAGLIVGLALGGVALLGGVGLLARRKRRAAQEAARGGAFDDDDVAKDEYAGGDSEEGSATLQNDYTDAESIPPPPEMEMGAEGEVDVVDGFDYAESEEGDPPPPPEEAPETGGGRKWGRFGRK